MLIADLGRAARFHIGLALDRTARAARALMRERRLGLEPTELLAPPSAPADAAPAAFRDNDVYAPTPYEELDLIARARAPLPHDVFVDLGCGKGRPFSVIAAAGYRRLVGVELSSDLAEVARRNAARVRERTGADIRVEVGDAAAFRCDDGTVYFLNNPFGWRTVDAVLDRLRESLDARPRQATIFYRWAAYGLLLDQRPWLEPLGRLGDSDVFHWRTR